MFSDLIDERFLLGSENLLTPFDFQSLFGCLCPVEIEIGIGRGKYILGEAVRRPSVGFLGIERVRKYLRVALARLNVSGCENVRLACEDAGFIVRKLIPDDSVYTYHIYFPDPWPKRRHRQRRLIDPDFATHLHRTLAPGGTLKVATDHVEYSRNILEALNSVDTWAKINSWTESARGTNIPDATHYEVKYSQEARPVFWMVCVKPEFSVAEFPSPIGLG
ncbi:MAG: tRNA (guanosine(46)-N7)-methyltransferase TrmB [bacterium]